MTPPFYVNLILNHFAPQGLCLEPCRGTGGFQLDGWDWCEITEGRDFLTWDFGTKHYDWIVTNPPWSKLRLFLVRSMRLADNVVFLCLVNALWMKARLRDIDSAGFGIREILLLDTPPKPWPQAGFALGAIHIQRGYKGSIELSDKRTKQ
jgi:hypothetical protein